ncbi:hypothetical protein [Sphaerisporangium dianthi]|uniref:Uncharacterized protein n=1 Tax=Sphaerisporangium dianthi TaxID=1436120 RepID=A0ABV9C9N7_9ACTN
MRSSINIRGFLAVAAIAAGAACLATGSASAATSCEQSAVTVLRSPGFASAACHALHAMAAPQAATSSITARHTRDELSVGFEHIGRTWGLPSRTAAVIGLHELPAIARGPLSRLPEGTLVYQTSRKLTVTVPGLPQQDDRPLRRGAYASDEPAAAPAPLMPVEPEPLPGLVAANGPHGLGARIGRVLTVDTTISGLRVR